MWGAVQQPGGGEWRTNLLWKLAVLMLVVAAGLGVTRALNAERELEAVNAANVSLRQTLTEMTVAITEKDRELGRLQEAYCGLQGATSEEGAGDEASGAA